jgi:L-amino acid N-acyltransferase YncA
MTTIIDKMNPEDWPAVRNIYVEGIATGNATFETDAPEWERWNDGHLESCRLLARDQQQVVGWAALRPVSSRQVYAGVAEVSIYITAQTRGCGVGRLLLRALIAESEKHGFWTLQAGIFPENAASIALHKGCGFREVGVRRRIGKLGNRWRDVVLMERRSGRVGV